MKLDPRRDHTARTTQTGPDGPPRRLRRPRLRRRQTPRLGWLAVTEPDDPIQLVADALYRASLPTRIAGGAYIAAVTDDYLQAATGLDADLIEWALSMLGADGAANEAIPAFMQTSHAYAEVKVRLWELNPRAGRGSWEQIRAGQGPSRGTWDDLRAAVR